MAGLAIEPPGNLPGTSREPPGTYCANKALLYQNPGLITRIKRKAPCGNRGRLTIACYIKIFAMCFFGVAMYKFIQQITKNSNLITN
jgi:hypothetical protein